MNIYYIFNLRLRFLVCGMALGFAALWAKADSQTLTNKSCIDLPAESKNTSAPKRQVCVGDKGWFLPSEYIASFEKYFNPYKHKKELKGLYYIRQHSVYEGTVVSFDEFEGTKSFIFRVDHTPSLPPLWELLDKGQFIKVSGWISYFASKETDPVESQCINYNGKKICVNDCVLAEKHTLNGTSDPFELVHVNDGLAVAKVVAVNTHLENPDRLLVNFGEIIQPVHVTNVFLTTLSMCSSVK